VDGSHNGLVSGTLPWTHNTHGAINRSLPASLSSGLIVSDVASTWGINGEIADALLFIVGLLVIIVGGWVEPDCLTGGLEGGSESILDPIQRSLSPSVSITIRRSVGRRWDQPVQNVLEDLSSVGDGRIIE
jgi:hypothetical protein